MTQEIVRFFDDVLAILGEMARQIHVDATDGLDADAFEALRRGRRGRKLPTHAGRQVFQPRNIVPARDAERFRRANGQWHFSGCRFRLRVGRVTKTTRRQGNP